jgi:putative ATP-dependent endonuclease of OLD family
VLRAAFIKQKPRSGDRWQAFMDSPEPSRALYERLRKTKKYLGKGEFAHDIATSIRNDASFECPEYLAEAIRQVLA